MIYIHPSRHQAFTIIELLIAIGIISTTLVTAMLMIRQGVTFVEKSKHEVVAI
jgi:prepilin-type N-terminal cleavage/methylation domain-containing protein